MYIKGEDRKQKQILPDCIEDYVKQDAPVRFIDKFVDSLDMEKLEFIRSTPQNTGAPGYDPRDLLKLLIYGYFYQINSSRMLAHACECNLEIIWLICRIFPDFRTISDFRKNNAKSIVKVFKEFNKCCLKNVLFTLLYVAIDGCKIKANNAKARNFTVAKLQDKIKRVNDNIKFYLQEMDKIDDEDENSALLKAGFQLKLNEYEARREKFEGIRDFMEAENLTQISLTDPDSRLMKANEGFCVGYNIQTAIDAGSHMITGFKVTNNATDHGQITSVATEVKNDFGVDILEITADKGYECPEDHADALASGIIPNVIQRNNSNLETVEFDYQAAEITEVQKASTAPKDLRACLEAGIIPNAYNGILTDVEITEVKRPSPSICDSAVLHMTSEEMRAKAQEGFFVRDAERNTVFCPQGELLRQKSVKRNGSIRYCNKLACKRCQHKCTACKFKEVDFYKDILIKPANRRRKQELLAGESSSQLPKPVVLKKVVRYVLHLDQNKMKNRKCLAEHPFGTIKRWHGHYYFRLKGFEKVNAETSLYCLSYNLRRAINQVGVPALLASLEKG